MAMTLGVAVQHGADTLITNTKTVTLTTGRGCVAMIVWQSATETISSVTVSGESNMTLVGTPSSTSNDWKTQIAYLGSVTTGASKTVTVNFSAAVASYVFIQELHDGSNGGIALDGFGNAFNNASTNPTVNVTTSAANSAIFAVLSDHTSDPTVGGSYTELNETAWYGYEASMYDLDAGAAGTYAANWTAASGSWSIAAAGFKPSAGGGGGPALWAQSCL